MIKSFLDLEVYQESLELSFTVEKLIRAYPKHELFLLVDQSRRASRAIPALIAQGYAKRESLRTFQKYLKDAVGEANEMITHLQMADQFGYIKDKKLAKDLVRRYHELGKRIFNLKDNWQNFK